MKKIFILSILFVVVGFSFCFEKVKTRETFDELIEKDQILLSSHSPFEKKLLKLYTTEQLNDYVLSDAEIDSETLDSIVIELKEREKQGVMLLSSSKDKETEEGKLPSDFNKKVKEKLIDNYEYFEKANLGNYEYNIDGTCGYVAAAILLGYYNHLTNGALIPQVIYNPLKAKNINALKESGGPNGVLIPTRDYHDYLYEYVGKELLGKSFWLSQAGITSVNNWVIRNNTNYTKKQMKGDYATVFGSIKKHINDNRPVIGTFLQYKYYVPEEGKYYISNNTKDAHNVVIYGYRETADGLYFIAHSGWGGSEYTKIYIKSGTFGRYGYSFIKASDDILK